MIKRNPKQWQQLFAAQQSSGLSQAKFCKQHHLCPKYFSLRRRQLTDREGQSKVNSPLIKVRRPEPVSVSAVSLYCQNIEVRFAHIDPSLIANVVKQLV